MINIRNITARNCSKILKRAGAAGLAALLIFTVGCKRVNYADAESTSTGTVTREKPKNDLKKKNSDVLNIGYHATANEKDPLKAKEIAMVNLLNLSYDSMFVMGNGGQVENSLVETYKDAGEGKFEFLLRSGVTFHDGSALKASDIVRTIGAIKESGDAQEAKNTVYSNVKSVVASAEAKDDKTLIMTFNDGGVSPLHVLTFPIISQGGLGTGLYKIDSFADNEVAFSYYEQSWKKAPVIKSIKAIRYTSEDSMAKAYKENAIDGAFTDQRNVGLYKYTKNTKTMNVRTNEFYYLMPNLASGKMSDLKVRQALSYGMDKESIVSRTFDSNAIIADFPIPSDYFIFDNQLLTYTLDVGKCIRKFGELGYTQQKEGVYTYLVKGNEKFSIRLIGLKEDNLYHKIIAQTISSQLAEIGVEVKVELLGKEEYAKAVKGKNYDIAIANTTIGSDFDLRYMLSTGGKGNFNATSMADMDTALNNIGTQRLDMVKVKDEYIKIQEMLVKKIPIIGLCFVTDTFVYSDRLSGVSGANSNLNMLSSIYTWNFEVNADAQTELLVD